MSQSAQEHRQQSPGAVRCAVITVSDTRTLENDTGGQSIVDRLEAAGHQVVRRQIIPDEPEIMRRLVEEMVIHEEVDAVLLTGGTGISRRDQTFETISGMVNRPLPGYGELFRMLSYDQIGAAAMLSRAVGGLIEQTVVLTMPGSRAAVELAMEKLILPELSHLVGEARK
jgi:molybdenum cofactor biosynthesis protein B